MSHQTGSVQQIRFFRVQTINQGKQKMRQKKSRRKTGGSSECSERSEDQRIRRSGKVDRWIVQIERLFIERGKCQLAAKIIQFHAEQRMIFFEQLEKDQIAFPEIQRRQCTPVEPDQIAFIAFDMDGLIKEAAGVEHHQFREDGILFVLAEVERDHAAQLRILPEDAGFFHAFSLHAAKNCLSVFKLSANADPFFMIDIVFLFDAMKHQNYLVSDQIAKCCDKHIGLLLQVSLYRLLCLFIINEAHSPEAGLWHRK